jgi:signal transduction histidine kinase
LYDKLKEVDEMKDEFISIASHELKTPMATIKGYINMMLEGLTGKIDPVARDHLIKVNDNVERLDILVSELLDVSRLEQERMQFDLQQVSLPKITEKVINNMMPYAKRKNLELIEEKFAQNLPNVFIDPDRFEQVLTNLISNAIKYTSKGSVKVVYSLTDDYLLASVKDTGIGMSIKDMERLFEKFYRIKNEKTAEIPGTGLGLWLSKSIAEKMNCQLEVKSELGKGSDFTIKIPLVKE